MSSDAGLGIFTARSPLDEGVRAFIAGLVDGEVYDPTSLSRRVKAEIAALDVVWVRGVEAGLTDGTVVTFVEPVRDRPLARAWGLKAPCDLFGAVSGVATVSGFHVDLGDGPVVVRAGALEVQRTTEPGTVAVTGPQVRLIVALDGTLQDETERVSPVRDLEARRRSRRAAKLRRKRKTRRAA